MPRKSLVSTLRKTQNVNNEVNSPTGSWGGIWLFSENLNSLGVVSHFWC